MPRENTFSLNLGKAATDAGLAAPPAFAPVAAVPAPRPEAAPVTIASTAIVAAPAAATKVDGTSPALNPPTLKAPYDGGVSSIIWLAEGDMHPSIPTLLQAFCNGVSSGRPETVGADLAKLVDAVPESIRSDVKAAGQRVCDLLDKTGRRPYSKVTFAAELDSLAAARTKPDAISGPAAPVKPAIKAGPVRVSAGGLTADDGERGYGSE